MDDATIAVLAALKSIRQLCDDKDDEVQDMIESIQNQDKITRDDKLWKESLFGQSLVWSEVGTRVGNMINETLFESLDKLESEE
jgi:hypothetical protein